MIYTAYIIDYNANKIYTLGSYKDVEVLTYICQILASKYNVGFWIEPKEES